MNTLGIVAASVLPGLLTFYLIVRRYSYRLRNRELDGAWDEPGVFLFGVVMAILWPFALLWYFAGQPSRVERKEAERASTLKKIAEAERILKLGSGS